MTKKLTWILLFSSSFIPSTGICFLVLYHIVSHTMTFYNTELEEFSLVVMQTWPWFNEIHAFLNSFIRLSITCTTLSTR